MPHRGVRAALRSPEQKPACSRAHHPAHWLPSALFPAQTGNTKRGKPPSAPRRGSGDPLPLLSPTAAVASCGRLRRAPGELLPGQAGLRCSGAGRGQSQPKSAAPQSKRETPRGTSSSLAALRAPRPARGSDLRLPRRVVRRDSSPGRARTAPLRTGGTARGPACRSQPRTGKLPGGRVEKAAASPALEAAAAPAKGTGRGTGCKALVPRVETWTLARGVLSRAPAARLQALPADRGYGPRPPRGARSAPAGGRGLSRRTEPRSAGGAGEGLCTSTHLEPQDLGR